MKLTDQQILSLLNQQNNQILIELRQKNNVSKDTVHKIISKLAVNPDMISFQIFDILQYKNDDVIIMITNIILKILAGSDISKKITALNFVLCCQDEQLIISTVSIITDRIRSTTSVNLRKLMILVLARAVALNLMKPELFIELIHEALIDRTHDISLTIANACFRAFRNHSDSKALLYLLPKIARLLNSRDTLTVAYSIKCIDIMIRVDARIAIRMEAPLVKISNSEIFALAIVAASTLGRQAPPVEGTCAVLCKIVAKAISSNDYNILYSCIQLLSILIEYRYVEICKTHVRGMESWLKLLHQSDSKILPFALAECYLTLIKSTVSDKIKMSSKFSVSQLLYLLDSLKLEAGESVNKYKDQLINKLTEQLDHSLVRNNFKTLCEIVKIYSQQSFDAVVNLAEKVNTFYEMFNKEELVFVKYICSLTNVHTNALEGYIIKDPNIFGSYLVWQEIFKQNKLMNDHIMCEQCTMPPFETFNVHKPALTALQSPIELASCFK